MIIGFGFPLVGRSQLALSLLCKILFSLHPSILVLDLKNLDGLEWSGPRASYGINSTVIPRLHFLFSSLVLHPTYLP